MQEHAFSLPDWLLPVLRNLASFGAGALFLKVITLWQYRRKPAVEINKTAAETTEITIRSHATAGDSLGRMMDRLDRSVAQNERLRSERDDLQEKCDKQAAELESYERQIGRMRAWLTVNGLKYPDAGDLRTQMKSKIESRPKILKNDEAE